MKKVLLLVLTVFTLVGCSSNDITISNGKDAIISGDKVNYTKQEFYDDMKGNDFTYIILADLNTKIAKLENIDLSDVDAKVQEDINALKEQYGDAYESVIAYYGGIDTVNANLKSSLIGERLAKNYFSLDYENLKNVYKAKKAKIAYFDTEDKAKAVIEAVKAGSTFEMAAAENGYGSQISEQVYTDKSELTIEVKKFLSEVSEPTLSDVILSSTQTTDKSGNTQTTNRYYVINVTNTDVDSFKDDFLSALNALVDSTEVYNYYFAKYDIEVYDQATFDLLSTKYEGIK